MKIKKYTKFLTIFAFPLFITPLTALAQAEDQFAKKPNEWWGPMLIRIYSETIELSTSEYAKLMSDPSVKDHTTLRNKLIKQVEAGKATLVSNHSMVGRSGEMTLIESVNEFSYPTKPTTALAPTPTNFQTKKLATKLQVTPIYKDQYYKTVELTLEPEIVQYVNEKMYAEWLTKGAKANVKTPNFFTLRLNRKLVSNKGEFTLVGVYTPELDGKPDNTNKLIHFVKVDILKVGKK